MIKEIKYKGYTATPSDYESPDGELEASVDLIQEHEAIRPIFPPSILFDLPTGYTPIFIHKTAAYTHYILQGATQLKWLDGDATSVVNSFTDLPNIASASVHSIGNILVIITQDATYFLKYEELSSEYTYLGTKIPELPISFGLQTTPASRSAEFNVGTINSTMVNYLYMDAVKNDSIHSYTMPSDDFVNLFTQEIYALHNPLLQEDCTDKNKFGLPFLVRYALRLYDGTLAMHSAPVLMIPYTIPQCNVMTYWHEDHAAAPVTKMEVKVETLAGQLDYAVLYQNAINECKKWKDIITSVEIFVSPPLYLYRPSEKIRYFINSTRWNNHFGVPRLTISKRSGGSYYDADNNPPNENKALLIALPTKTENEVRTTITEESRFYHIASINIEDLTTTRTIVPIDRGCLSALTGREVMTDGYQEHDAFTYNGAFNYNARILFYNAQRVSGITAMRAGTFMPHTDNGVGNIKIRTATEGGDLKYNNLTGTAITSHDGIPLPFVFFPEGKITDVCLIYTAQNSLYSGLCHVFKTKKHDFLSGAYLYLGFDNIIYQLDRNVQDYTFVEGTHVFQEPNKLYLSEVNNPFLIRPTGIISIDVSEIFAVSTAAKALSQGQFGQFPLYAFTSEGVWALEVSTAGTISARQPITRDVCISSKSILQIDSSVLFVTDRGIMLLSGSNSQCISDSINDEAIFALSSLPGLSNISDYPTGQMLQVSFLQFVSGCGMLYDYKHQRIIVYNPTYSYAYVYSITSKQWGMMSSNIMSSLNSYPDALAMVDMGSNRKSVANFSASVSGSSPVTGLLITRPLKLDAPDVLKTIDTVLQRGVFRDKTVQGVTTKPVKTILYGSRDLYNWQLVYSSTDHRLRGFRGTPYKYFRIVLLTHLAPDESITGCTIQYTPRLLDQPR